MPLASIEEILQDVRLGRMVVLMDDEDRENEGDVVMAAECVTAQHINFMAQHARGLICMPMSRERSDRLGLKLMVESNGSRFQTKFTTSIEAASGVTTGISAADRARTVQAAAARNAKADDIVQPGHIFPLLAEPGGVLVRAGHTEAACDLARMAGFGDAGVICEVLNEDGSMARRPDLEAFATRHGLKIGTIAALIEYRVVNESTVEEVAADVVRSEFGEFRLHAFRDRVAGKIHLAMVRGRPEPGQVTLVRVQGAFAVRDLLGVHAPDGSGWNVRRCLERIAAEGRGVVVLLGESETPGQMLASVEHALGRRMPAAVRPPLEQQALTIGVGSQILRALGVHKIRLMGSAVKYSAISGFGLEIVEYLKP